MFVEGNMTPAEKFWRAKQELPRGHIGILESQEELKQEYQLCHQQEWEFFKKWKQERWINTLQVAADCAGNLCRSVGTRTIKEVRLREPDRMWSHGYYKDRTIYLNIPCPLTLVVHETAHHIVILEKMESFRHPHGEGFCEVEQMLFNYLLEWQNSPACRFAILSAI